MANNQNINSTILSEHRRIVGTRYILATFNFLAVLLGMIVTLFFVSRRGIYDAVLTVIWALIVINVIQIVLCLGEYILRSGFGINLKALPIISYIVGGLWVIALVLEMVLATFEAGTLRTDLLIVAAIQAVVALVAYILWPNLDRRAIDSMIKPSSRGDEKKRAKKAKRYVATYGVLTALIVLAQAATLLLYKMPPTFYDLFADNRALQYELNEDKDGYIVSAVYNGTSPYVNIPATYNNLPVVGIKSGALVDDGIIEKYKITSITFGTPEKDENGNEVMKSNLQFINAGAIVCSRIESIAIPESVTSIEDGAIRGAALRTLEYSSRANFDYSIISGCPNLARIIMSGEHVGVIASLEGMPDRVNIQVDKDIYNAYRESNLNYVSSFSPILADDEFCIDFFTGCDYYIDSIFAKKGESVKLSYADLKKDGVSAISPAVDTLAYIKDAHELGTDGAKANSAFRGWYFDGNYVAKADFTEFGEISLTESAKIYAKWINEYNATLNWGTYKPAGQVDKVYWTEEDDRDFPVVTDRNGYSKGVVWTKAGTDVKLENSDGITESIALNASWQFDAPTISLDYVLNGGTETITVGGATFTYDEYKMLQLSAVHSHALESDAINNTVDYDYEWFKDGVKIDAYSNTDVVRLQNVRESGVYTLRVTATPHYYADAGTYAEINYNVQIAKKSLDLGDVIFDYLPVGKHFTYNSGVQTCTIEGNPVTQGIVPTYTYSNENGYHSNTGMINAGEYNVSATFAKVDPNEAENYETKTLTTKATVKPIVLATPTWSEDSFLYNKTEHKVYINFVEAIAGEDVGVIYEGGSAIDAGKYTAIVTGVTNPNYTLVGVDAGKLSCSWEITKRPISVQGWYLDGNSATGTTYNGASHTMIAAPSGAMSGDEVSFLYANSDNDLTTAVNAGTYTAKITGVNNANYELSVSGEEGERTWTIAPARLTVTFNNHGRLVYNGAQQTISATVAGIVADDASKFTVDNFNTSDTTASVALIDGDDKTSVKLLFGATNVAAEDYVAKINGLNSGEQHLSNYVIETAKTESFNIEKKLLNVIAVTPVGGAYVYNGGEQHMLLMVEGVVVADREKIDFTIGEGGRKVDDVDNGVFIKYVGKDAGSYPTSITAVNDANYTIGAYTKPLTINKKAVTVSGWTMFDIAQNKSIGWSENGEFTYNKAGYRVGYTLEGVIGSENVTLALSNYEKQDASNSFYTTTAALDGANEVNKNYSFESSSVQWKINPKSISLTWKVNGTSETSFVYSKTEYTAAYTVNDNGIIEGDKINLTYKSGEGVTSAINAGNYKITVESIGNSNYKLDGGASFQWSITPKPVDLVWTIDGKSISTLVYNGGFHDVAVTVKGDDVISGDTVNVTLLGQATASVASSYTATAAGLSDPNYKIADSATKKLDWTIEKLPVQIVWMVGDVEFDENYKFVYNRDTQYPTATFVNKCSGDVIGVSYSGIAMDAGNHKIVLKSIDNSNYTIDGVANTECEYTIEPKVVVPHWNNHNFKYTAQNKTQTAYYNTGSTSATDGCVYTGDSFSFTYKDNVETNAGTYKATVIGTTSTNYVVTSDTQYTEHEWTIAPAPVTLFWSHTSFVYNSEVQYPTATVSNNYGQEVTVTTIVNPDAIVVGKYTVTVGAPSNQNFTLDGGTNVEYSFNITPRNLNYEWYGVRDDNREIARDVNNLVYDGYQTRVLVRFTNLCAGDDVTPVYANNVLINADSTGKTITVTLDGEDKDNYTFPEGGITRNVKVAPQPVKITWAGVDTLVYDGAQHELVPTVTAKVAGNDSYPVSFNVTVNYGDHVKASDVGEYNYLVALTDSNFTLANCEGPNLRRLTITPAEITVTWENLNHIYDSTLKTATATSNTAGISISLTGASRTAAGSQTVTAVSENKNYKVTNDTATLVIEKAKIKLTWIDLADVVYDGEIHKPTVILTNESNTAVLPNYTLWYNDSTSLSPKNADTYRVRFNLSDSANFELTDPNAAAGSFTISRKVVNILSWSDNEFYYDGVAKTLTVKLDDAKAQETVTYKTNSLRNAGEITATVSVGSNYIFAEGTVTTRTLKINPAIVTVTWNAQPTAVVYDGATHSLTAHLVSNTGVDVYGSYTYNGSSANNAKNAGSYVVAVALTDTANFVFASNAQTSKTLTIERKELSVSWDSINPDMTYKAGKSYSLTPTMGGNISGDYVSFVYHGATTATDAGTYNIKISALAGNNAANYKLPESGLEMTYTVKPQAVKIVWNGLSVVYDGNTHTPGVSILGVLGDAVACTLDDGKVNAGEYEFTVSLTSDNYTLEGCQGNVTETMTIAPMKVAISWPTNNTFVYDGSAHTLVPVVTGANGVDISREIVLEGSAGKNVGVYYFEIKGVTNPNYTIAGVENVIGTLTVTPRPLTVRWDNLSQTYGMMSETTVFATLENTVYGQDVYVIVNGFSTALPAGNHILTANTLAGEDMANYEIMEGANTTATLVVNKQKATAEWSDTSFEYDREYHAPTLTVKSMTGEDLSRFLTIVPGQMDAGEYYYLASDYFQTNPNYELMSDTSCTLKITPKQLRTSDATVTYDRDTHSFSLTFNGLLAGDEDSVTIADDKLIIVDGFATRVTNGTIDYSGSFIIRFNVSDIVSNGNYEIVVDSTSGEVYNLSSGEIR